jgi:hypothetical protein
MSVLTQAHRQWASRPSDERFGSLADMRQAAIKHRNHGSEASVDVKDLRVKAQGNDVRLIGKEGQAAELTHWSFGQLASKVKAPASYLRTLPATLVEQCLNNGLGKFVNEDADAARATILFDKSSSLTATVEGGRRRIPRARVLKAPEDDRSRRRSRCANTFLYEYVCGNHRVWGVSEIKELRVAHIHTDLNRAFGKVEIELKRYADSSAVDDEAKVASARKFQIGATKQEILDAVFKLHIQGLPLKTIGQAYDLAEKRVDWYGSPRSAWGLAGGITEIARDMPNADTRLALDKAATRVMQMAF